VTSSDRRATDLISVPRARIAHSWMDVRAISAATLACLEAGRTSDARIGLVRIEEYARKRAAEAEGIGYVAPDQLPLFDQAA
jgi:hypothetical protein